jgi:glutaredoxin
MDKIVVLFTMKTCPYCQELKDMLVNENIDFFERDIHEYEQEYQIFSEITGNDYVPAFMTIENPESESPDTQLYAPERDFDELEEGVSIIKEFYDNTKNPI